MTNEQRHGALARPSVRAEAPAFYCKSCGAHHSHWSLVAQLRKSIELLKQRKIQDFGLGRTVGDESTSSTDGGSVVQITERTSREEVGR
jgi:hypothetical protein